MTLKIIKKTGVRISMLLESSTKTGNSTTKKNQFGAKSFVHSEIAPALEAVAGFRPIHPRPAADAFAVDARQGPPASAVLDDRSQTIQGRQSDSPRSLATPSLSLQDRMGRAQEYYDRGFAIDPQILHQPTRFAPPPSP
ncbi:hypothetical protein JCM5353_008348 [Sporobolomyces roseus]